MTSTPGPDPALIPDLDDGVPTDDAAEPADADVAHLHPEED